MNLDYTLILNCHTEGVLAHRAVKSLLAMMDVARDRGDYGYNGELLIVADRPDDATCAVVDRFIDNDERVRCSNLLDFGDLGLARNAGVEEARGEYVFFFDADDVWGDQWLVKALDELTRAYNDSDGSDVVVHPQLIMNFGADKLYWQHTDCRSPKFDPSTFFITNHWTANCGASRETFLKHPYRPASADTGFGFEDYEWNSRTWAAGVPHIVVPETVHFIRKHLGSMSHAHAAQGRTIWPGGIFAAPRYLLRVDPTAGSLDKGTLGHAVGDAEKFFGPHKDILAKLGPPPTEPIGPWAHDQAKRAHQVEPEVWADPRDYIERKYYSPPALPAAWAAYWPLRETMLKANPTHVIFGAGLGGGADRRVGLYAGEAARNGGRPLVIWTGGQGGQGGKLAGVQTIAGQPVAQAIGDQQFAIIMQRAMLELSPGTVIHIVNSAAAYNAIATGRTASALKACGIRVFASMYAIEKNRDDQLGGYAVNGGLTAVRDVLDGVITDCRSFAEELEAKTGWPQSKTFFVPSIAVPLDNPERPEPGKRFLWCGRFEWAKNPMLLVTLAKAMTDARFTVVGPVGDEYGRQALERLRELRNVVILPAYDGELPYELAKEHDALLVTSTHEGMPNLVLEALRFGLPVVGTHVGGLCDLAGSTFVSTVDVHRRDDVEAWRQAMAQIEAPDRATRRAHEYLHAEHSPESVTGALKKAGWLNG